MLHTPFSRCEIGKSRGESSGGVEGQSPHPRRAHLHHIALAMWCVSAPLSGCYTEYSINSLALSSPFSFVGLTSSLGCDRINHERGFADMATEKKSKQERIAELQEKQKQLKAQERKLKAQISQEERKKRTKYLIEIGGAVYSVLGDSYQEGDVEKLVAFLRQQDQRGNYFSSAMGRTRKPDNHN